MCTANFCVILVTGRRSLLMFIFQTTARVSRYPQQLSRLALNDRGELGEHFQPGFCCSRWLGRADCDLAEKPGSLAECEPPARIKKIETFPRLGNC